MMNTTIERPANAPANLDLDRLNAWTLDGRNDLLAGVDQQAAYLSTCDVWPRLGEWRTTAEAKDLMSKAMLRKAELLFPSGKRVLVLDSTAYPLHGIAAEHVKDRILTVAGVLPEAHYDYGIKVRMTFGVWVNPMHIVDAPPEPSPTVDPSAAHRDDIARIGEVFWDEAKKREWCNEAEQIIDHLNDYLTVKLPASRPVTSWTVKVSSSALGCGYFLVNGVEADSEEDAIDTVRQRFDGERFSVPLSEWWGEQGHEESLDESELNLSISYLDFSYSATASDE
jgi:hypothetical protein